MLNKFWKNRNVLVSGHTGFKGTWLVHWLRMLGANVCGISLKPEEHQLIFAESGISQIQASYECDICDVDKYHKLIYSAEPDVVFHLAAQAIVRDSFVNPAQTFNTNLIGTVNTLDAIRKIPSIKSAVFVTTDKVYENKNLGHSFSESDPLGGDDPYSASKACAELAVHSYRKSFFDKSQKNRLLTGVSTARAGNVIGGGDWGRSRIVPDLVRAKIAKRAIELRHPNATRPWQHVLDALHGYILLAEKLYLNKDDFSGAWNFGPKNTEGKSVLWLAEKCAQKHGVKIKVLESPSLLFDEKQHLNIDSYRAQKDLGWRSYLSTEEALDFTWDWYERFLEGESCTDLCQEQIATFHKMMVAQK